MTKIQVLCGNCKNYHPSSTHVKACYDMKGKPATYEQLSAIPTQAPASEGVKVDFLPELGRYTVEFPDGSWKTLRFKRAEKGGLAGKVIASYLAGPDNDSDYIGFANSNEGDATLRVWNRFKQDTWLVEALRVILKGGEGAAKAGEAYALKSGRCYRCGRTLTVPASIHRGLGPDCAELMGL